MGRIGIGAVLALDEGDEVVDEVALEIGEALLHLHAVDIALGFVVRQGTAIRHDDDHRHRLLVGIEIIHDDTRYTLQPLPVVATDAVQQVEHRVFLRFVVLRGQVDGNFTGGANGLRLIGGFLEGAFGNVGALLVEALRSSDIGIILHIHFWQLTAERSGYGSPR